jgi:hypothetical protein
VCEVQHAAPAFGMTVHDHGIGKGTVNNVQHDSEAVKWKSCHELLPHVPCDFLGCELVVVCVIACQLQFTKRRNNKYEIL